MAEGFGVQNVSGLHDQRSLKWIMGKLLHELAFRRIIRWDTWFSVAAIVHLGCPWHEIRFEPPTPLSGVSTVSAVQYGSCVIVAEWTDISSERKEVGCFAAKFEIGYHIQGISDNFAVVQTEETQHSSISEGWESESGKYNDFVIIQVRIRYSVLGSGTNDVTRGVLMENQVLFEEKIALPKPTRLSLE